MHPKVSDIFWKFIEKVESNFKKLRENFRKDKSVFQYVYSIVYPDIYCSSKKRGYDLRSEYLTAFKEYKDRIKDESLRKNAKIYEERKNSNEFEQKSIKIDDFAEEEEKEIKARKRENEKDAKQLKKKQRTKTKKEKSC